METGDHPHAGKFAYTPPKIVVMDEEEMLRQFQVTSAQAGWWVPPGPSST